MQTNTLVTFGVLLTCSVAVTAAPQLFQPLPGACGVVWYISALYSRCRPQAGDAPGRKASEPGALTSWQHVLAKWCVDLVEYYNSCVEVIASLADHSDVSRAGAANARMSVTAPTGPADPSCWSVMRLNAAALQSGEWELNLPCAGNLTAQGGLQAGANQRAAVQDYGADAGRQLVSVHA